MLEAASVCLYFYWPVGLGQKLASEEAEEAAFPLGQNAAHGNKQGDICPNDQRCGLG